MSKVGRVCGWTAAVAAVAAAAWTAAWMGQRPARLRVESSPGGGAVYVDGRYAGLAPVDLEGLAWGPHHVSVERPGHEPWRKALDLAAEARGPLGRWRSALTGSAFGLKAELSPLAECALVVESDPPGAEVFLDGALAGLAPLRREGLTPGKRAVRLRLKMHEDALAEADLAPGREARVERKLKPLILDILRGRIDEEPNNLHNYVDLSHELLIRGKHEEALKLMWKGHELLAAGTATAGFEDERLRIRFYYECFQIYTGDFEFPREGSEELVQGAYDIVVAGVKTFPDDTYISNLLKGMDRHKTKPRKPG